MAINIGSAVAFLELDTSKFKKGFNSAINDLKVFGDKSATATSKMKGLSSAFKTTGSALTKNVTVPLVGIGTMASKVAIDFEAKMSEVQAISGATGKEFEELEKKAIEMGAKTKFSAGESADAFKYMAMAGWNTEEMLNSISGVMDLAAASGEDLALTSDIVTDAMTAFGLSADGTSKVMKDGLIVEVSNATRFVDVLAKASSRSNTNVAMMGETFKYVAPVAGSLGYSVEDTAVAIGLMANSGIKASQAGTSLRSIFTRLVKPVGEAEKAVDELGISVTNTDGTMKPLSQTMEELRTIFDGLTESEKAQYASMLAGQEGMSGLLAIVNASEKDFKKLTEEINNSAGATKEMSDVMMDNTAGAIEQLKGALESAGIVIGQQLTPYIRQLAEWITSLVEKFNSLSEEEQKSITKFGVIVASIGPVLLIISKLINVIVSVINIFNKMRLFITKIIPIFKKLKSMISIVVNVFNKMKLFITKLIPVFLKLKTMILTVGKVLITAIQAHPVVAAITAVIAIFVLLWNKCEGFRKFWINLWNSIKTNAKKMITNVIGYIKQIPEKINNIKTSMKNAGKNIMNALLEGVKSIGSKVLKWVSDLAGKIAGFVSKIIKGFSNINDKANSTRGATRYIDGSHADGLPYVPYNGYIAELHEGERVLTKQENKDYNRNINSGGDTYNFYNVQPSPYEYARQMKRAKKELLYGV